MNNWDWGWYWDGSRLNGVLGFWLGLNWRESFLDNLVEVSLANSDLDGDLQTSVELKRLGGVG